MKEWVFSVGLEVVRLAVGDHRQQSSSLERCPKSKQQLPVVNKLSQNKNTNQLWSMFYMTRDYCTMKQQCFGSTAAVLFSCETGKAIQSLLLGNAL